MRSDSQDCSCALTTLSFVSTDPFCAFRVSKAACRDDTAILLVSPDAAFVGSKSSPAFAFFLSQFVHLDQEFFLEAVTFDFKLIALGTCVIEASLESQDALR